MKTEIAFIMLIFPLFISAQNKNLEKVNFLLGKWEGTGEGFSGGKSEITSNFKPVMNGNYIEVENESFFEPTEKNPDGEHHIDKGFIYFNKDLNKILYRQFNIESYVNTYVLIDSLSDNSKLVFETIQIDNFIPGGKAKWTVEKISNDEIITTFDVSFGKGYKCFGTNRLTKIKD